MVPVARRMIFREKLRFFMTVCGVGFTVMLMLFLFGIYEGAKRGSTSYVRNTLADVWICQKNSTNLLRSSSFLHSLMKHEIELVEGVGRVDGILRVITTAVFKGRSRTLFLFGFDPESPLGRPPALVQGTPAIRSGEIILDKAFVDKYDLSLGDRIEIQGREFRVSGVSTGTNAIVAQFAFTTLQDAQRLLDLPDIISFWLVTTDEKIDGRILADSLQKTFPSLGVFSKREFVENNLEEMETGILPVLWTIALFGGMVGVAVITLMLYGSILEKREDYALLKAIGASHTFLVRLVVRQSLFGALIGFSLGFLLTLICAPVLLALAKGMQRAYNSEHETEGPP